MEILLRGFLCNVALSLVAGTAFSIAGPVGTQIHNSQHIFGAIDQGRFVFMATAHTAEIIRFRASSGAVNSTSPNIRIT